MAICVRTLKENVIEHKVNSNSIKGKCKRLKCFTQKT